MNFSGTRGERHAVYYAPPPDHVLWRQGCDWLGRDPHVGGVATPPGRAHVEAPWRYGFHATLKAPMTLAEGAPEAGFIDAVQRLAAGHAPFVMPALHVATLGEFVAIRPREPLGADHPLRHLADDCVVRLDPWRAAADADERSRQIRPGHDDRQQANVDRYGYAHVLDDWRFHMTLSDPLPEDDRREAMRREAGHHFAAALALPLICDALCLFVQPQRGAPFELRRRITLGAAA